MAVDILLWRAREKIYTELAGGASSSLTTKKTIPRGSYHRARGNSLFRARGYQGPYKGGPAAAGIRCWISGPSETHVSEEKIPV
jgi:hypothetical protein